MVALSLGMMLTLALTTSYLFIARGDRSLYNYGEMNTQARKLLEILGRDLRAAVDVTNFAVDTLTLTLPADPANSATEDVTWEYNPVSRTITRQDGRGPKVLARDVETFAFYYANGNNVSTTSLAELKQVQLSLRMLRLVARSVTSEYVISAQFTMRAKSTTF